MSKQRQRSELPRAAAESQASPPVADSSQAAAAPLQPPEHLAFEQPRWPGSDEALSIAWPGCEESDPQVDQVVGWNWENHEVAVVVQQPMIQNSRPWNVVLKVVPMPEEWLHCKVLKREGGIHEHVLWYCQWNRAGLKAVEVNNDDEVKEMRAEPFTGPCLVIKVGTGE